MNVLKHVLPNESRLHVAEERRDEFGTVQNATCFGNDVQKHVVSIEEIVQDLAVGEEARLECRDSRLCSISLPPRLFLDSGRVGKVVVDAQTTDGLVKRRRLIHLLRDITFADHREEDDELFEVLVHHDPTFLLTLLSSTAAFWRQSFLFRECDRWCGGGGVVVSRGAWGGNRSLSLMSLLLHITCRREGGREGGREGRREATLQQFHRNGNAHPSIVPRVYADASARRKKETEQSRQECVVMIT